MKYKLKYSVYMPSELSPGLRGFNDFITITIDSGDPGGLKDEFADYFLESLKDWYSGATVKRVQ